MDEHDCTPQLWDPATNDFDELARPGINLFCSGHAFLPDGRLFVAGGHDGGDSKGDRRALTFDPGSNDWDFVDDMNRGRWYPTVIALPNGGVLAASGQDEFGHTNVQQFVWKGNPWAAMGEYQGHANYPRMHVISDGRVAMVGILQRTVLLDMPSGGTWEEVDYSEGHQREEGSSVMYDVDKVIIIGGGRGPQKTAETIDFSPLPAAWQYTDDMSVERRHHNATLLPDGTVFVTGGTKGNDSFNDLDDAVFTTEAWNPSTGHWTTWASQSKPRLYHSVALLLPDATVLSAGGGEFRLDNTLDPNDPQDSHRNAQIFSPPYLFKSTAANPRPDLSGAPANVVYGQSFHLTTSRPEQIARASLVRLGSVTHGWNMNQRINFCTTAADATGVTVTPPANANVCPPGHYMLFLLNTDGVPSISAIVRVGAP